MTATVLPLFPKPGPGADQSLPHPLVAELRTAVMDVLEELTRRMFDSADDMLFEMGEKSPNDAERRRYFDTMRVLRLDQTKVAHGFAEDLAKGFAPGAARRTVGEQEFDLDSLSIQPTEELEEKIAITNMAAKAEGLFKSMIWEVERRLEWAAQQMGVPISPMALSPGRICEAFGKGTSLLETDFQIKLVVYKLFDRVVILDLDQMYRAALELLDRHGVGMQRRQQGEEGQPASAGPGLAGAASAMAEAAAAAAGLSPGMPAGASMQNPEFLRRHHLDPASLQRSGNPLATELAGLLQSMVSASSAPAALASSQRLSLAGRMFDDILAEPMLPEPLRPAIEKLRYPVYRTALTDPNFFANQAHPLRRLLADLLEQAVSAQTSETAQSQLRETLRAAAALQSEPGGLRAEALAGAKPVSENEVEGFLHQMREQTRARREALLMRVRRQVAQELEVQTLGRAVPSPVMNLLRGGVGPLMAVRLLKHGRGSSAYREAQVLPERILHSLEYIPPPSLEELQSRESLLTHIVSALADIGMDEDKIEALLNGLQEVYALLDSAETTPKPEAGSDKLTPREEHLLMADFDQPAGAAAAAAATQAPAPPPPKPAPVDDAPRATLMDLLRRVLTPESWYRVYDPEHNQTRWLKLSSFHEDRDSVTFTGFDEAHKLNLRANRFAEDLARGSSEPINADDAARAALDQLKKFVLKQ
jgi:uncharacterized protein DUF1631